MKVICPVSVETVQKMERISWTVELWSDDKLLGTTKLNLEQIYDQVFEQLSPESYLRYLRGNLYPLVLYDGDFQCEQLHNRKTMAVLKIKLAFGTTIQINRYSNKLDFPRPEQLETEEIEVNEKHDEIDQFIEVINDKKQEDSTTHHPKNTFVDSMVAVFN